MSTRSLQRHHRRSVRGLRDVMRRQHRQQSEDKSDALGCGLYGGTCQAIMPGDHGTIRRSTSCYARAAAVAHAVCTAVRALGLKHKRGDVPAA